MYTLIMLTYQYILWNALDVKILYRYQYILKLINLNKYALFRWSNCDKI